MSNFKRKLVVTLISFSCLGVSALVLAQTDRGTITGTVSDATGGVVGGATVTATNQATGIATKVSTGANGAYTIPLLQVGSYRVTVEQPGFKKAVQEGVSVQVGQTARVDIRLEVGEISQSVEIQAEATLLRPDTSDVGTVITNQQVQDLPLAGQGEQRSPAIFMILAPGVTGRGFTYSGGAQGFAERHRSSTVSGSQSGALEFHLDGSIIAQGGSESNFRQLGFPQDAVGEFKITTLNAPAEYGRSGAGITSFTLKSGTNQFHGSVYEYFRNEALDARGFFASRTPLNKQNEFGATAGGPIKKDKTFFFGWYNGFRVHKESSNFLETVPTDAFKQGDLSANLGPQIGTDALGRPVIQGAAYDPLTTRTVTAGQLDPVTGLRATSNATIRDPFPGNRIPSSRFDSVSRNIIPLFPATTRPGLTRNYQSAATDQTHTNQWGAKIDHALTASNRINGSFVWSRLETPGTSAYAGALSNALPSQQDLRVIRISNDLIARSNLINHATFGFNRSKDGTNAPPDRLGIPRQIGLKGVNPDSVMPGFNIAGQGNTYGNTGIGYSAQNHFDVNENLSWIKGRHTFKFGFEYLKTQLNTLSFGGDAGYFTFGNLETGLPGFPAEATGVGMASFLLGRVNSGRANVYTGGEYDRFGYYGAYVQDDFKVNSKFTLNYGLRYDLYRPTVEKFNHLSWVERNAPNPAIGGFPGTVIYATPDRRTGVDQYNKGFAPRLGLAYSINSKTVLRTSYGIFWAAGGAVRGLPPPFYQTGFNAVNVLSSPDQGITPALIFQDGWPASRFPAPPFLDPAAGFASGVRLMDRDDGHPPYLQNWTFNIQRELPGQILFDVAYAGNKGTRLQSRLMPTNHLDTKYLSLGSQLNSNIALPAIQALPVVQAMRIDPATGNHVPFVGFERILGGAATLGQALRPLPQYTNEDGPPKQIRRFFEGTGNSTYHALQAKLNKRFSAGLSFLVSYTWSKTLTDAESQFSEFSGFVIDPYNKKAEKSYSLNDYPHNLVVSYSYELPFGPGRKFVNGGGASGKIVGGWRVAAIQQYQSGGPGIIQAGEDMFPYAGANGFLGRPNRVPGVDPRSAARISGNFDPAKDGMFNPAAFSTPAPYTFGNGPRTYGDARRFFFLNEDISLIKRTSVSEQVSVEFRADFLNVFNRTVFGLGTGGDQYGTTIGGFGVNSQTNLPREIQFGLKINY